ncbi:MAG: MBOAT family protein [Muribaculaceae bacterium]|nr:MBOAT family protein [Muribaculaceae bacterium]
MLFNTLEFAIFLPIVFGVYWALASRLRLQNLWVVAASYLFYGLWNWRYLLLILLTTASSFATGRLMDCDDSPKRKIALWVNIAVNVGVLFTFKYFNFFAENFTVLLNALGMTADGVTLRLALPVGISFYTIQAIGYSIDVYFRRIEPCRSWLPFFAFISFFPQLVAGPIERAANLLPQFERRRRFDYAEAVDGCRRILWGLFKKVVVADSCAAAVDIVYSDFSNLGSTALALGAVLFSFQIYGDFSGYSDIAIGVGRLFGIRLKDNFRLPYFSRSIREFWARWHISLTGWFRDYIYIPLGGNRCGKWRHAGNTVGVFLLSGLWHGAAWPYVAWGALHGWLYMPGIFAGKRGRRYRVDGPIAPGRLLPPFNEAVAMTVTAVIVALGWVVFRSPSMAVAGQYLARMFIFTGPVLPVYGIEASAWCVVLLVIEWIQRNRPHVFDIDNVRPAIARYIIYWVMLYVIHTHSVSDIQFIYFQF